MPGVPGTAGFGRLLPVAIRHFFALFVLVGVAFASPFSLHHASMDQYGVHTVEVSEGGFNPGVCRMNREYVQFKNVGSKPIRVIRPGIVADPTPLIDTGYLEPGETSNKILIPHGGTTPFYDADEMSHSMTVVTPVFVMSWDPICTPDPNFQPPQPPCRGNAFCLRLPGVALD
jgi:hypothetical protein